MLATHDKPVVAYRRVSKKYIYIGYENLDKYLSISAAPGDQPRLYFLLRNYASYTPDQLRFLYAIDADHP